MSTDRREFIGAALSGFAALFVPRRREGMIPAQSNWTYRVSAPVQMQPPPHVERWGDTTNLKKGDVFTISGTWLVNPLR